MRILVDTSVWIEHLRRPEGSLVELLGQDDVLMHPWVDAQLLASCLARPCRLWTRDKRVAALAAELHVGWSPPSR